jgi:DNA-binding transcriptional MerR regulator
MWPTALKVGELARQTGISVRTLHYYDEIGLLTPSCHTGSGHRLYGAHDIARLQQVRSLRQLGFSLGEIRDWLDRPDFSPRELIRLQRQRLSDQLDLLQCLCRRLEGLERRLESAEEVSVEAFLETMEAMSMLEKYYTPEQMDELRERGRQLGDEHIRQVEAEWPQLIAKVRAAMDAGADPASAPVQALARRWTELVREFTGGNPGIEQSLRTMYQQEPGAASQHGLDPQLFAYVEKAIAAAKQP